MPEPQQAAPESRPPVHPAPGPAVGIGSLPLRILLTSSLIVAAVLPVAVFGIIVMAAGLDTNDKIVVPLLVVVVVGAAFFGLLISAVAITAITTPLRHITTAVERVAAGEPSAPIHVSGDEAVGRCGSGHEP